MQHWLGPRRLPMLIADTRRCSRTARSSPRAARAILGMAPFGRDHLYLLDASDGRSGRRGWPGTRASRCSCSASRSWSGSTCPTAADLRGGILVHSGGWKELADQAVTPRASSARVVAARTGIERVHNFYGMAEQTGTVYVECEAGALHAPATGDVVIRDPATWAPAPRGEQGVVEVVSTLPESYPGHALLTEDLGRVVAVDDGPCGRLGQAIALDGRVPKAELRGCSDTAAAVSVTG